MQRHFIVSAFAIANCVPMRVVNYKVYFWLHTGFAICIGDIFYVQLLLVQEKTQEDLLLVGALVKKEPWRVWRMTIGRRPACWYCHNWCYNEAGSIKRVVTAMVSKCRAQCKCTISINTCILLMQHYCVARLFSLGTFSKTILNSTVIIVSLCLRRTTGSCNWWLLFMLHNWECEPLTPATYLLNCPALSPLRRFISFVVWFFPVTFLTQDCRKHGSVLLIGNYDALTLGLYQIRIAFRVGLFSSPFSNNKSPAAVFCTIANK